MEISSKIQDIVASAVKAAYAVELPADTIQVQATRADFEGDFTIVTFPLAGRLKEAPPVIADKLGQYLVDHEELVSEFGVVKGFLNLSLSQAHWYEELKTMNSSDTWWKGDPSGRRVLVEYSSPNTNKPLHLGHVRNILLGWSMSCILKASGDEVYRVQIINDRGIAICKSMLSWQKWGEGITPEAAGVKPDHFVGDWYVQFEKEFRSEYEGWQQSEEATALFESSDSENEEDFFKGYKNTYFNEQSTLGREARSMLIAWEDNDPTVRGLWNQMNGWVYDGFNTTYDRIGVRFDKLYYESETFLLGKEMVREGIDKGVFFQRDDGSVWVDLTEAGMDEKILLRSDGTSVYVTQDLGTAQLRYDDFGTEHMIYVVGDEQNYHFKVLFETLKRLEKPYAGGLYHLSYGLVDLPTGRMKTREGTVVDADDLMDEVYNEVKKEAEERGEIVILPKEEQEAILHKVSLGALKYFIIKVEAKKRMTFNPAESVDLQGQTGPYIQNAYVRIQSILRKAGGVPELDESYKFNNAERELIQLMSSFRTVIKQSADQYNPGHLANYCYTLAKTLHRYYHDFRILNAESDEARIFRLNLINQIGNVIEAGMKMLGIDMPSRM